MHTLALNAHHSPDLFHVQQELTHALSLPLQRQTDAAAKELAEKQRQTQQQREEQQRYEQGARPAGRSPDWATSQHWCTVWEKRATDNLLACQTRQQQSRDAVRGLADDYHPFDQATGKPLEAEEVQQRLSQHVSTVGVRGQCCRFDGAQSGGGGTGGTLVNGSGGNDRLVLEHGSAARGEVGAIGVGGAGGLPEVAAGFVLGGGGGAES